jgi:hypothetical protein
MVLLGPAQQVVFPFHWGLAASSRSEALEASAPLAPLRRECLQRLGEFLLVASLIALGDAAIVLRSGGAEQPPAAFMALRRWSLSQLARASSARPIECAWIQRIGNTIVFLFNKGFSLISLL